MTKTQNTKSPEYRARLAAADAAYAADIKAGVDIYTARRRALAMMDEPAARYRGGDEISAAREFRSEVSERAFALGVTAGQR